MKKHQFLIGAFSVIAAVAGFAAQARAEVIYGLTSASSSGAAAGVNLVTFDSSNPAAIITIGALAPLVAGQTSVRSIDFRPNGGKLYAVSMNATNTIGQLYTVNLTTAVLTPVGVGFSLGTNDGVTIEMDFNPVVDAIRILTSGGTTNNNFRVDPTTGALIATDTTMAWNAGDVGFGLAPLVVAGAYSNNVVGAASTTLYGWDFQEDALITIGSVGGSPVSPNAGTMFTVNNPPGFLTSQGGIGMDISGVTGILYVTHDDPASSAIMRLYTRNLTTGAETILGTYPAGTFITDISVRAAATAGEVTVSGRVLTSEGRGLLNARVTATDSHGIVHMATTARFGRYSFTDLSAGESYVLNVKSRTYNYSPRVLQLSDSLTDIDFTPEP